MGLTPTRAGLLMAVCLALAWPMGGCVAEPDHRLVERVETGEFGRARGHLYNRGYEPGEESGRDAMLERSRFLMVLLADGLAPAAEDTALGIYDTLRTQGLNAGKEAESVILNEDLKNWKGEPFEQALLYHSIAAQQGSIGSWGNARASSVQALRLMEAFEQAEQRESLSLDGASGPGRAPFPLALAMAGASSLALNREQEAREYLDAAVGHDPALASVRDALLGGANTLLVVEVGSGPRKLARGADRAIADWSVLTRSDATPIVVRGGASGEREFAPACDVNRLSRRYTWDHLRGVREGKSLAGNAMLLGGTIALSSDDEEAQWVGLGLIVGGLFATLGAHADTRHLEVLPQRYYLVPLRVEQPDTTLELAVPGSRLRLMRLAGVDPPGDGQKMQMRIVRMPETSVSPAWASSGAVQYANDRYAGPVPGDGLPYILGGRCVRAPSSETLRRYQAAGQLAGLTLADLESMYRDEGLEWSRESEYPKPGVHVLEGGRSLVCPQEGTAGYARIFGQDWPAYLPRSERVRALAASLNRYTAEQGAQ